MNDKELDELSVAEIMERWPVTITVFARYRFMCIGCPIGRFHTIADATREHGASLAAFRADLVAAIAAPASSPRRPEPVRADRAPAISAVPLQPDLHSPRR